MSTFSDTLGWVTGCSPVRVKCHTRLFWAVRSVPQLLCPDYQLHLNLPQNSELGLIPDTAGYGGGQSWSWHTADWWSHWETEKPVDQHHPETTSLNRLRESGRRVSVKRLNTQTVSVHVSMCVFVFVIQECVLPAVFWSQILTELSWEDVATQAVPLGGIGINMQQAVVWRWPLYSTTLQPGWRRSQS